MPAKCTATAMTLIVSTSTCVLLGLLLFGTQTVSPHSPLFQIVTLGLAGAVSFTCLRPHQYRDALVILVLWFVAIWAFIAKTPFVTTVAYYTAATAVIGVFSRFVFDRFHKLRFTRPLLAALMMGVSFLLVTVILTLLYAAPMNRNLLFVNMPVGFVIGLGLGIGFEISDGVNRMIKK